MRIVSKTGTLLLSLEGGKLFLRLWHAPMNAAWIWFDRRNLRRFQVGWVRKDHHLWWAVLGFSGSVYLQSWPWQRSPAKAGEQP